MSGKAYIGTSGFTYGHWKDVYARFNNDARGCGRPQRPRTDSARTNGAEREVP